jgi:hypothetical protein
MCSTSGPPAAQTVNALLTRLCVALTLAVVKHIPDLYERRPLGALAQRCPISDNLIRAAGGR